MGRGHEPGAPVERPVHILAGRAGAPRRCAVPCAPEGIQPCPNRRPPTRSALRTPPRRPRRRREDRCDTVAHRRDHDPAVTLDGVPQDRVVALAVRHRHLGLLFPQARRPLQVGEQKGHRPDRKLHGNSLARPHRAHSAHPPRTSGAQPASSSSSLALGWTPGGDHLSAMGMEMDDAAVGSIDAVFVDPSSHLVLMTMFGSRGRRRE